jgi:hypothetical protein
MPKWAIEIQKCTLQRRNLADLLEGLRYELISGGNYDVITSNSLDKFERVADVWVEAKRLQEAFAGPAKVDPEFQLGAVIQYGNSEPKKFYCFELKSLISGAPSATMPTIIVVPPPNLSASELVEWKANQEEAEYQLKLKAQRVKLEPAYWSQRALKIMKLLEIEIPTGEEIYKIYELMEGHPRERQEFQKRFGIAADEFARFKDTVHNPVVSGNWARHAYEDPPKTENPMSIGDAKSFVHSLARKWLTQVRDIESE